MSSHLLLLCLISVTTVPLIISRTVQQDIIKYIGQIQIIRDMLAAENCVDPISHVVDKRNILGNSHHLYDIELEVQRGQYQRLRAVLIECRRSVSRPSTSTTTTPRPPTTMTTATLRPTTTPKPLPAMCRSATNLTESWRKDHTGSGIRPRNGIRNCDAGDMIAAGRPWFKFSGAAGNRLMNKCVPSGSCGTGAALWSDDPMPTQVGVVTQINVYAERSGYCKDAFFTKKISVVRCSTSDNDYIYRYDGSGSCPAGFCGMSA